MAECVPGSSSSVDDSVCDESLSDSQLDSSIDSVHSSSPSHITHPDIEVGHSISILRSFYRAFNSMLGKVANASSEIVVIELLKTKCLPILYYGLEVCPINRTQQNSLNYVLHTSFRKIFRTRSTDVVLHCMDMFNCPESEDVVLKRKSKFLIKYASLDNLICYVCQNFANPETAAVSVVWPA